jgi:hypothetical protein
MSIRVPVFRGLSSAMSLATIAKSRPTICLALVLFAGVSPLRAYDLERDKNLRPISWTRDRTVVMHLSLGGARQLSDGFTSFNQSALDALNVWNPYLAHLRFAGVPNSLVVPAENDEEMSVLFSDKIFGRDFGSSTLAVTLLSYRDATIGGQTVTVMEETDTLFNSKYDWDSYRGPLRAAEDFHRVAIHEFGHTLGLDHPDLASPPQHVNAIMNSTISNVDTVQADDISGVQSIYSTGPAYQSATNSSVLRNISTRGFIGTGDNVVIGGFIIQGSQPATVIVRGIGFSLSALGFSNAISDPVITVYDSNKRQVATNDDWFTSENGATIASYGLDPANSIESALYLTLNPGSYTAVVQGYSDSTTPAATGVGLFELYDLHTDANGGRAGNVSTRGQVGTGGSVLIGGFIIGGSQPKDVIVRALGPSLANSGVANSLSDPTLELHDGNGNTLRSNNDWQQDPNAPIIASLGFAPSDSRESALFVTLNPGNYTAVVQSANGATGVGLVEVYDLSSPPQ